MYILLKDPMNRKRTSVAVIFAIIKPRNGREHTFKANDWLLCGRDAFEGWVALDYRSSITKHMHQMKRHDTVG